MSWFRSLSERGRGTCSAPSANQSSDEPRSESETKIGGGSEGYPGPGKGWTLPTPNVLGLMVEAVRDVPDPPPPALQRRQKRSPYVYHDSGSLMVIWAGWAMRIVWDGGRMGYTDRWRWLAPISTRFKLCPYRKDDH